MLKGDIGGDFSFDGVVGCAEMFGWAGLLLDTWYVGLFVKIFISACVDVF